MNGIKAPVRRLTVDLFISACNGYGFNIQGGTIHDFLRGSRVKYYGGKCPVYYVEYFVGGSRVVVGGNYATNGAPRLSPLEELDFI